MAGSLQESATVCARRRPPQECCNSHSLLSRAQYIHRTHLAGRNIQSPITRQTGYSGKCPGACGLFPCELAELRAFIRQRPGLMAISVVIPTLLQHNLILHSAVAPRVSQVSKRTRAPVDYCLTNSAIDGWSLMVAQKRPRGSLLIWKTRRTATLLFSFT